MKLRRKGNSTNMYFYLGHRVPLFRGLYSERGSNKECTQVPQIFEHVGLPQLGITSRFLFGYLISDPVQPRFWFVCLILFVLSVIKSV